MSIIRCTQKLRKEMGLRAPPEAPDEAGLSPLAYWHANLIYIARRKCVLFTNDQTLYNFIAPDVSRAQIRELGQLFLAHLRCVLFNEALSEHMVARVLSDCAQPAFGKSNNRRVLRAMNDLAFHYERRILEAGGPRIANVPGIIRSLNYMPMRALGFAFPIEALRAAYETRH